MNFEHKKLSEMAILSPPFPATARIPVLDPTEAQAADKNKVIDPAELGGSVEFQNDGVTVPGGPFAVFDAIGGGMVANGSKVEYTPPSGGGGGGDSLISETKTASFTAAASRRYEINLSGASADITATLPTSPSSGDVIRFEIETPHASNTYGVAFARNGNTFRKFDTNEDALKMRYVSQACQIRWDGAEWVVDEYKHGRTPTAALQTSSSAAVASGSIIPYDTAHTTAGENDPKMGMDTSNKRFTPEVPGWYKVQAVLRASSPSYAPRDGLIYIGKNGSSQTVTGVRTSATDPGLWTCGEVYMNGTTDYVNVVYTGSASLDGFSTGVNGVFRITLLDNIP